MTLMIFDAKFFFLFFHPVFFIPTAVVLERVKTKEAKKKKSAEGNAYHIVDIWQAVRGWEGGTGDEGPCDKRLET